MWWRWWWKFYGYITCPITHPTGAARDTGGLWDHNRRAGRSVQRLTDPSEMFVYAGRNESGFGTWSYENGRARARLVRLAHLVDDLGNPFPAAKYNGLTRSLDLAPGSSTGGWAGNGVTMHPQTVSAPNLANIPRNWRFANLYRFGEMFLDYTLQIDIDSAGILSGFDTNGCDFRGELRPRSDGVLMYDARIIAAGCGATSRYIENAEYTGFAYIRSGPDSGQTTLEIDAVNRAQQGGLGIAISLWAQ